MRKDIITLGSMSEKCWVKVLLVLFTIHYSLSAAAQQRQWSLRECCDYAVANNISIKQQENQCRQEDER